MPNPSNPLRSTSHRPYPLPDGPWVMAQVWQDLLFAHWRVDAERLRTLLPQALDLDLHDGCAWLGIVPFRMSRVRLRFTPALPWISAFPELNVRTYLRGHGKPAVYFFSLDAASRVAVRVARAWFHLPYFDARMRSQGSGSQVHYFSERVHRGAPAARLHVDYHPTGDVCLAQPGTIEHWLTERYGLFTTSRTGHLIHADIHHLPWPLQPAAATFHDNTMTSALQLPLEGPPLCHFARYLDVRCYSPRALA